MINYKIKLNEGDKLESDELKLREENNVHAGIIVWDMRVK